MLAFVNCSHFPVKTPDVSGWGISSGKPGEAQSRVSQMMFCGSPAPATSGCSFKLQIPKLHPGPTNLGDGVLDSVFFNKLTG